MDYFNGITNDDFKEYFLKDLHSRMQLEDYTYPSEFQESSNAIDEHIIRCQENLTEYIVVTIKENDTNLDNSKLENILKEKEQELAEVLHHHIEEYYKNVKVTYIDL